ncbi:hypothetical protein MFLAVUS_006043 [Mucor flavus]|uniref:Uncharacterized protein n=1 Tax=Mucor flavus TaxID=439312 RepID=A0ABP9Z0H9_9FUNG
MENTKESIYGQLANLIDVEGLNPSFAATLLGINGQVTLNETTFFNANNNHGNTRGVELLRKIYGSESESIELELNATNSDLYGRTKQVYGNLLAETTYLNCLETELVLIITLIQMNTLRQLCYHLESAKKKLELLINKYNRLLLLNV